MDRHGIPSGSSRRVTDCCSRMGRHRIPSGSSLRVASRSHLRTGVGTGGASTPTGLEAASLEQTPQDDCTHDAHQPRFRPWRSPELQMRVMGLGNKIGSAEENAREAKVRRGGAAPERNRTVGCSAVTHDCTARQTIPGSIFEVMQDAAT